MTETPHKFQAEVSKLLDIVAHSLYSHKEIFLRELISNASDACDRLRYAALTQADLMADGADLTVTITPDKKARTLTIADSGIGLNKDDLIENLGTIARSGTAEFMTRLSGDAKKDVSLIGQFGVGFYSAFMVADQVVVISRKAGESQGWRWSSDGRGEFTVDPHPGAARGACLILHLKEGEDEFLEPHRLRHVVTTYSDHIAIPVVLKDGDKSETLNAASALWTRSKSDITPEQYKEFYHHVGHAFDDPWLTLHYRAEGAIEYTGLLFIPSVKPFDLFHPDRKNHVKLYVKRVFIADDGAGLLPPYLRFLKGVVDSADLPLNISREMLQHNPVLSKIRSGLVKRILSELTKKAQEAPEDYLAFWANFGAVLKEGLYEDAEKKDEILELCRFAATGHDQPVSLAQYVAGMREGQTAIYTITGDSAEAALRSPQLEGFKARGLAVLLLTDPIDEFWVRAIGAYKDKPFKAVTEAGADLDSLARTDQVETEKPDAERDRKIVDLVRVMKEALGDAVKDVRRSERLTESPVCLVAGEGEMSLHLERLMRQHRQMATAIPRILEINPGHPLIAKLAERAREDGAATNLADTCLLLLDQARLIEGETLPDPAAFARRLNALMLTLG